MRNNFFTKLVASLLVFVLTLGYVPVVDVFASGMTYTPNNFGLTLTEVENANGKVTYELDWDNVTFKYNDDSSVPTTRYYVARRKVDEENPTDTSGEYKWELRGNYTDEGVKVLNIYPNSGDGLQSWMNSLKSSTEAEFPVNITVDKQSLSDFNSNPNKYLKKASDGSYNYDVVVFGFWDTNNHIDISKSNGAYDLIDDYIKAGYGVIFGHDTIQMLDSSRNPNFTDLLLDNSSFVVVPRDESGWHYSEKITVKQQGALTTYPFDIYGKSLTIPMAHNVNQLATDSSTVYMTFDKNYYPSAGNGPYYNYNVNGAKETVMYDNETGNYVSDFDVTDTERYLPANSYLMKDDNVAFIQCGHSSGKTSTTEQMILANTIYSLKQMFTGTHAVDQILDTAKPEAPVPSYSAEEISQMSFDAEDNGSEYKYRIIASPVGLSIYDEWDNITPLLDDESTTDYVYPNSDGKMIAFSQIADTGEVKAEIRTADSYGYYVDNNETAEKRENTYLNQGDMYTFPAFNTISENTYLHIWSYDNANSFSFERTNEDGTYTTEDGIEYTVYNGITNINLYDAYPKINTTVKYVDTDGNAIEDSIGNSEYVSQEILGSTFAPTIPTISGYRYVETDPTTGKITVGEDVSANIITYIYDKLYSKPIKIVVHHSDVSTDDEIIDYKTATGVASDDYIIDLPQEYLNYKYEGYYTVGNSSQTTSGTNYELGSELEIENSDTLYLHYIPIKDTFNVQVVDKVNSIIYADFDVTANVGETSIVTSEYINDNINSLNSPKSYQNYKVLDESLSVDVVKDATPDQVIELIPRTKTVQYLGYDFGTVEARTTSGTSVKGVTKTGAIKLGTKDYTYDGTNVSVDIDATNDGTLSDWAELSSMNPTKIHFNNNINTVSMMYYKGDLPTERYTVTANYYDIDTNNTLDEQWSHEESFSTQIPVPMNEYDNYELDKIVVTPSKNGVAGTARAYAPDDNIYEYLPDIENGSLLYNEYNVDLYYRPYYNVVFEEYLIGTNESTIDDAKLIGIHNYHKLYEDNVILEQRKFPYPVEVMTIEGDATENTLGQYETKADKTKVIKMYYRPLTYDLTVIARSNGKDNYQIYDYKDVQVDSDTAFLAPTFSGYTFREANVLDNNGVVSSGITKNDKVLFSPSGAEGDYTVYLEYNQNAEVDVTFIELFFNDNSEISELDKTEIYTDAFVGEDYTLHTLDLANFDIVSSYVDGKTYEHLSENANYIIPIDKVYTHVYVIYAPATETKHKVTLNVNPEIGGDVFGNTTRASTGDNLFFENAKVTINAQANKGYEFVNWTTGSSNVTLEDPTNLATSFKMPNSDVVVTANFKEVVTEPTLPENPETITPEVPVIDPDDNTDGEDNDDNTTTSKPVTPPKVEPNIPDIAVPTRPTNPGDTSNIVGLIEDPTGQIIREYEPYIQGYPEGDVRPSGAITRAEVMQVIYNLYGYGLYRDSYGDLTAIESYNDVDVTDWYADAVAFCIDYGVVGGYADGTIRADEPITRAELATILSKFILEDTDHTSGLSDIDGMWATDAINKLHANGIINGYPDGTFKPNQTTIRSEFTVMVNRLVHRADEYNHTITFPDLPETHWAYDDMMNAANGGVIDIENAQEVLEYLKNNQ